MNTITLLTGGGRSGKSRYALELAKPFAHKAFIATAEAFDDEMRQRIANHQKERSSDFVTIEEPIDLARAIRDLPPATDVAIIDCMTLWLCNLMCRSEGEPTSYEPIEAWLKTLQDPPCNVIIVTNELGMGIVPMDRMTRCYRDLAGMLNQRVATIAHRVILMVCGLPMVVKDQR